MPQPDLRPAPDPTWWRRAVTYQIYIRSFADGDGDGIGDIAGIRQRLPHLADLGVDALWINPWYPSPMADGGYDVADYRDVEPLFGTLADAEAMIAEAHALDLRVILDVVPNHTSDQHAWFQAALAAGPGSPERDRYVFRKGRGPDGDQPPTNWVSVFGGPAWHRVTEPDGTPGEWYLHIFAPEQPDVNWQHPEVVADFEQTLRFWFDRGVDGFRIDVAHALVKDDRLRDLDEPGRHVPAGTDHPFWDRDGVHEVYRSWRALADAYDPPRTFVGEAWVDSPERLARYVRRDELHTSFNFDFLTSRWLPAELRETIGQSVAELMGVGAPSTWVLSNHDVVRQVSRYGRPQAQIPVPGHNLEDIADLPVDTDLGRRRARAAALLMLALPGAVYLYQGEELGLDEVEDLPLDALQDPYWQRSGHTVRGRDGCRVPMPWEGEAAPFGFSPDGAQAPWLPQPDRWAASTADAQRDDPTSVLSLYRDALRIRRQRGAFGGEAMRWLDSSEAVLLLARPSGLVCAVNLGADPVDLPEGEVLLTSGPLDGGRLPQDVAAWVQTDLR